MSEQTALLNEAYYAINALLSSQYEMVADGAQCKRCMEISTFNPDNSSFRAVHGEACAAGKAIQVMRKIETAVQS